MADAPDQPVYLLTGSDRPKIETALTRLRRHFQPEAIEVVSALEASGEDVVALCNAGSLFGDARLVIAEDVDGRRQGDGRLKGGWKAADAKAVEGYLSAPAPDTVLALVAEGLGKTSALWKACAKAGKVLEFTVPKPQQWVAAKFRERGVDAEPEACALLIELVGEDLHALASEVEKLATWATAGEVIGDREVAQLVHPTAGPPIYELTNAWAAHDTARALAASEPLLDDQGKPRRDNALRLAGWLGSHAARLRSVKRLADEGLSADAVAERLGINPYRVPHLNREAEGFSQGELDVALTRLAELDGALKGRSKLQPDLELQRAIVDLARRPGEPVARARADR